MQATLLLSLNVHIIVVGHKEKSSFPQLSFKFLFAGNSKFFQPKGQIIFGWFVPHKELKIQFCLKVQKEKKKEKDQK